VSLTCSSSVDGTERMGLKKVGSAWLMVYLAIFTRFFLPYSQRRAQPIDSLGGIVHDMLFYSLKCLSNAICPSCNWPNLASGPCRS
jgi:hypothetical protein